MCVGMIEDALNEGRRVVIALHNDQYFIDRDGESVCVVRNGEKEVHGSVKAMLKDQLFFGQPIGKIIDEIYLGII